MRQLISLVAVLALSACGNAQEAGSVPEEGAPKALSAVADRASAGEVTEQQKADFGTLAQYVGQTFKGAPTAQSDEASVDTQKWEWALGGKAILIRHALADGSYGGDTYVYKDAKSGALTYVYITNAGFHTVGEMTPTENGWIAEEAVTGHDTITRVRSTSVVDEAGVWTMTSEVLTSGEWQPGHAFEYVPTSDPLPVLKRQ